MTGSAVFGRRLVENHCLRSNYSRELMTLGAPHILVRTPQREFRALLMIEKRRLPLHAVMTLRAARYFCLGELFSVNVFMAVLALCRRPLEIHIEEVGLKVRRFMTVDARRRPMRSKQGELRLRVIEAG